MLEVKMKESNYIGTRVCLVCRYEFYEEGISFPLLYRNDKKRKRIGFVCPWCIKRAEEYKNIYRNPKEGFELAIHSYISDFETFLSEKRTAKEKLLSRIAKFDKDIDELGRDIKYLMKIQDLTNDKSINCPSTREYVKMKKKLEKSIESRYKFEYQEDKLSN